MVSAGLHERALHADSRAASSDTVRPAHVAAFELMP